MWAGTRRPEDGREPVRVSREDRGAHAPGTHRRWSGSRVPLNDAREPLVLSGLSSRRRKPEPSRRRSVAHARGHGDAENDARERGGEDRENARERRATRHGVGERVVEVRGDSHVQDIGTAREKLSRASAQAAGRGGARLRDPGDADSRRLAYSDSVRRALAMVALSVSTGAFAGSADGALRLVHLADGFERPVHVTTTASEPSRLYVVEQRGVVRLVERGRVRAAPFLDIRSLVSCCGEQGLLSLAFHPRYAANGRLYVNYTNRAGDTRVVEYRSDAARTRVRENTARVLLAVDQPYANHNGGQVAFGRDGFLYVAMGDGGGGGDPGNRAQDIRTRLGKLLRLNVGNGVARIVALGLRNPWRFSVDRASGALWIGDVGQGNREEIDIYRPGARGLENYGWRRYEGSSLFEPATRLRRPSRLVMPVHEYATYADGGCAVTGGFVYRGSLAPSARGRYFFGDYCNGRVSSFALRNGRRRDFRSHASLTVPGNLSSFGETASGELLLVSHGGGRIYRLGSS